MPDRFGEIPIQPPQSSSLKKRANKRPPSTVVKPAKEKTPGSIRVWGWVVAAVLLFSLYSCLGFLGVPYYLTEIIPKKFNEATGMVLEPSGIKFNPLTFRLETEKVRIVTGSGTPIMSLNSFVTDLAPLSLLRMDMVSNTVAIEELDLNFTREMDGSYNFQKFLGDKKVSDASKIMDFSDLPFFFSLNNISIKNSRIVLNDSPTGKTHTIEKIQLDLPTFSNIPFQADQYLHPRFSAVINGSPVELTGQARIGESYVDDQATNLSCDIHSLDLPLYSGYLPFDLPFEFNKGKADGKIELYFDPQKEKGNKLSIGFELQISGAELQSENKSMVITVPTSRVSGKLQPTSRILIFESIALREPTISSYGESFPQNIRHLVKPKEHSTTPGVSGVSPFHLIMNLLIMDDGIVRLFKDTKDKKPTSTWKSLQLSVKNYTSRTNKNGDQDNGSFRVSGEKEGTSSYFSWQGALSTSESPTGLLTLVKINSSDLLEATGEAHPFQLQGIADLKGQLSLVMTKNTPSTITYKLKDSEISIEGFKLLDKEKSILEAPLIKIKGLNFESGSVDFGNVYLGNSTAQFAYGKIPEPFQYFSSGKYRMQGIEFDGKATLASSDKGERELVFSNLSLKANELDTSDKTKANLSLTANTSSGGILKAQGYVKLAPFSLTVKTGFSGLPAKDLFSLFTKSSLLKNVEGDLGGKGSFFLPKKSFTGELQLTNGSMKISEDSTFSWKKSVFQDINYTAEPFHLGVALAEINNADLGWKITAKDIDPLQQLAVFFQKNFPAIEKPSGKKQIIISPVDIQEITFSDSKVHIQDHRLQPRWEAEIVDFAGKIQDIHSAGPDATSAVSFTGELDDSPFTIQGEVDLFSHEENGKVRFSLEKYPLASYHEQLSPKVDVNTSVGEFDLTLGSKWQDKQYHSSGSLLLTNLEPVSKTADSALPLALLTGPDNSYRMNFEFSRSAPAAKTVLLEELLTLFQTLIVKGSVSPLLLATGDFTDLIGNEFAEFRPGEFVLSDKGREILTRYNALLIAHPSLGLELSEGVDKVIDKQAIREQLEATELKRVENENKKLFDKWQAQTAMYETKLQEQHKKAGPGGNLVELDLPIDVLIGFIPLQPEPVVVDEAMLLELAQKRINVLYQHFTTQLAVQPERIAIAQPNNIANLNDSQVNGVKITLRAIDR